MLQLVPYGESDSDDDAAVTEPDKDPKAVGSTIPVAPRQHSTSEQAGHQGRVRSFPHVTGNYPTHVFVAVPAPKHVRTALQQLTEQLKPLLDGLHPVVDSVGQKRALPSTQGSVQDSYHLSLSRTIPIKYDQIDPLIGSLHTHLAATHSFSLKLGQLKVFINDQRTRTFLALGLQTGAEQVCQIIHKVDVAFRHHGLQTFHEDPDPHVSIAWMAGDAVEAMHAALRQIGLAPGHRRSHQQRQQPQQEESPCQHFQGQQPQQKQQQCQQTSQIVAGTCQIDRDGHAEHADAATAAQCTSAECKPADETKPSSASVGTTRQQDAAGGQQEAHAGQLLQVAWSCKVHQVVCRVGQRDHVVWSVGGL